jgi:hypothetical protein
MEQGTPEVDEKCNLIFDSMARYYLCEDLELEWDDEIALSRMASTPWLVYATHVQTRYAFVKEAN